MHPLNTLIQSQRHQVRQRQGGPPRYRSETEEAAALDRSHRERRGLALVSAAVLVSCLCVAALATMLI